MNTLAVVLLLGLAPPAAVMDPAPADAAKSENRAVTVRVTSALGEEEDPQVRKVVAERVTDTLEQAGFSVADGSSRLVLVRVGRSESRPTDYEVHISTARRKDETPARIESFACPCSGPELLDEIDGRLRDHLPDAFDQTSAQGGPNPAAPPPLVDPNAHGQPNPSDPRRAYRRSDDFVVGVSHLAIGAGGLVLLSAGLAAAAAQDPDHLPPYVYAPFVVPLGVLVSGAILVHRAKKQHEGRLTRVIPLAGRF